MSDKAEQSARFREAARKVGADESDDALSKAFGKLKLKRKPDHEKDADEPKGD